jgi:thiamine biosynthesis lipoprotein
MKRLSCICLTAIALLIANCAGATAHPKPAKTAHLYTSHYENVLGTSLDLKVMTGSPQEAEKAEKIVLQKIAAMSGILSAYDAKSEFSRWLKTAHQAVPVSHELFEVLALFDQWRIRTGGALDASAEVITRLWRQAAATQQEPTSDELANAVRQVAQPHWKLDASAQTATHLSNAPLILNSFAKSYIIKHAADAAMALGNVKAVIVNIGGDLVVSGSLDENIAISDPRADAENDAPLDFLRVSNKAIATSGNYRRGELIGGRWYSHIVDPRTGQPADNILSATVVASNATDAGALATAFNVMSPAESQALAGQLPGVQYLIITKNGERFASPGWKALEIPGKTPAVGLTTAPADFELIVNLEINLPKEGAVKRPYIAVWVENEDHAPVRTISVWHGSDRFMPELKSWFLKYRGLYMADKNFNSTVTSATRSAGKYTVKWDGKDDQGNLVKPGKYIIKIEASREHGTYQLMRQEIDCDETPKVISLVGNIEIASASLDYRKRTNGN